MSRAITRDTDPAEIAAAAASTCGEVGDLQVDWEHGQWWVTNRATGGQWSVIDASTGIEFECVTEPDDSEVTRG